MPLALTSTGRLVKAGLALAAAVLVVTSCGFEQGPPGRVVDKHRSYSVQTKTWTYKLTVRAKDGEQHKFRVGHSTFGDCRRGSKYPTCTSR